MEQLDIALVFGNDGLDSNIPGRALLLFGLLLFLSTAGASKVALLLSLLENLVPLDNSLRVELSFKPLATIP
jgi:hypothetical protein